MPLSTSSMPQLSAHAAIRMRQRGVRSGIVGFVLAQGDTDLPVGGGCIAVSISRDGLALLRGEGCPAALLEQAEGVTVVEGGDGTVVTVMHRHGRAARRYRRG